MGRNRNLTCAPRPCASCPYRKDVPSGIWHRDEYEKLLTYDGDIPEQLMKGGLATFLCHQRDGHLCAGWVAAHGPHNLLALRLDRGIDPAVFDYETDIPVFSSGSEAHAHGLKDMDEPGEKAQRLIGKLLDKGLGGIGEPNDNG